MLGGVIRHMLISTCWDPPPPCIQALRRHCRRAPGIIYFSIAYQESGLLYRIKFLKTIGFCPRCCCWIHSEQISTMVEFRRDNVNMLGVGDTAIMSITRLRGGAESNKHGERVEPSYIANFDIWRFDTGNDFQKWTGRWVN